MGHAASAVSQTGIAISLLDLFVGLSLAFLIGLWVVFIYRLTHRGLNYERSFLLTLLMIGPIICVVMMFIGSNLALSLGMVGALSIIRFRTVIKDSRDMVYLFWMIAVGLGSGTSNWAATTAASLFIGIVLYVLHLLKYGHSVHSDYVLVVSGEGDSPTEQIEKILKTFASMYEVRSLEVLDKNWEVVFEIRCTKERIKNEKDLIAQIKKLHGVHKVSLLAPQLALPV